MCHTDYIKDGKFWSLRITARYDYKDTLLSYVLDKISQSR